jgi:hypothetical protein
VHKHVWEGAVFVKRKSGDLPALVSFVFFGEKECLRGEIKSVHSFYIYGSIAFCSFAALQAAILSFRRMVFCFVKKYRSSGRFIWEAKKEEDLHLYTLVMEKEKQLPP